MDVGTVHTQEEGPCPQRGRVSRSVRGWAFGDLRGDVGRTETGGPGPAPSA